jgi:hypothetical protein
MENVHQCKQGNTNDDGSTDSGRGQTSLWHCPLATTTPVTHQAEKDEYKPKTGNADARGEAWNTAKSHEKQKKESKKNQEGTKHQETKTKAKLRGGNWL